METGKVYRCPKVLPAGHRAKPHGCCSHSLHGALSKAARDNDTLTSPNIYREKNCPKLRALLAIATTDELPDAAKIESRRLNPVVETQLAAVDRTTLLIYGGMLARYDQMTMLERLRDRIGRPAGIPGLWLLLPGQQAVMDGRAVPILSLGQRCRFQKAGSRIAIGQPSSPNPSPQEEGELEYFKVPFPRERDLG